MKLLTINTHSLIEDDYEHKLSIFTDAIYRHRPHVIAMQEVNQSISSPFIAYDIKRDNHVDRVCSMLNNMGLEYKYIWCCIKEGYPGYEEGIAVMSRLPVTESESFVISKTDDKKNWRRRKALGVKVCDSWFYSVHMGRYDDADDPFSGQWERFCDKVRDKENVWVMGDFNCDAGTDGYKEIIGSGWYDSYVEAKEKDLGTTVGDVIDGWRDTKNKSMRIDYIFSNKCVPVKSSSVIFNGNNEDVVSDHYGVLVEV